MPKIHNTLAQRKAKLVAQLSPANVTSLFRIMSGGAEGEPLDQYTVDKIKQIYTHWFEANIKEELHELLKYPLPKVGYAKVTRSGIYGVCTSVEFLPPLNIHNVSKNNKS